MRSAFPLALVLGVLALTLVVGCASSATTEAPKPDGKTTAADTPSYPDLLLGPDTVRELGYSIQWQTPLALPAGVKVRHAVLINNRLVVTDSENVAYVVDANSGQRVWSAKIGTDLERFTAPVLHEADLLFCSETRAYIYDINTGEESRTVDLYYGSNTSPAVVGDLMVHGNGSGYVFGQDINRGIRIWQYKFPGAVSVNPVKAASGLVVATSAGYVGFFEPGSGTLLWQQRTFDKVSAEPIGTDLMIYVACEDRSLYAFERSNGAMRWRYFSRDPLTRDPALAAGKILLDVPSRGLVAVDAFTGEEAWASPLRKADYIQTHGDLIDMLAGGKLHKVKAATGEVYQSTDMGAIDRIISDKPDESGNLFAIDDQTGKVLKLSPR